METNNQVAEQFLNRLGKVLDSLARQDGEGCGVIEQLQAALKRKNNLKLKEGDVRVRYGGNPVQNPQERNRREIEVYRIDFPGEKAGAIGDLKVYIRWDESNPELIIPNLPLEQVPSLMAELSVLAQTKQAENEQRIAYKPPGKLQYEAFSLPKATTANFVEIGNEVLAAAYETSENAVQKVLNEIQDRLQWVQEVYANGYNRHQKACQQATQVGKEVATQTVEWFSQTVKHIPELTASFQKICHQLGKHARSAKERVNALTREWNGWLLAQEAYTLAQKCQNGNLNGEIYNILTHSPGEFSITENTSGNCLMKCSKDNLLSLPKIEINPVLSDTELKLIIAQLKHINNVLGKATVQEYIQTTEPKKIQQDFGNFRPSSSITTKPTKPILELAVERILELKLEPESMMPPQSTYPLKRRKHDIDLDM